jgi:hypothetical protein
MRTLRVLIALGLGFVALLCVALVAPASAASTAADLIRIATPATAQPAGDLPIRRASVAAPMLAARHLAANRDNADFAEHRTVGIPSWCARRSETRWFQLSDAVEPRHSSNRGTPASTTGDPTPIDARHAAIAGPQPSAWRTPLPIWPGTWYENCYPSDPYHHLTTAHG